MAYAYGHVSHKMHVEIRGQWCGVVSIYLPGVLGMELRSSGLHSELFNCWAISPALKSLCLLKHEQWKNSQVHKRQEEHRGTRKQLMAMLSKWLGEGNPGNLFYKSWSSVCHRRRVNGTFWAKSEYRKIQDIIPSSIIKGLWVCCDTVRIKSWISSWLLTEL